MAFTKGNSRSACVMIAFGCAVGGVIFGVWSFLLEIRGTGSAVLQASAFLLVSSAAIFVRERWCRTASELEMERQRFRDVADNANEWFWEVDGRGRFTYSSSAVLSILGYPPQEILGKRFYVFFDPGESCNSKKFVLKLAVRRSAIRNFISANIGEGGRGVIIETNGVPIVSSSGKLMGYRGVNRDVTERLNAEEKLQASELEFRSLSEALPIGIRVVDPDGKPVFANMEWGKIFEVPMADRLASKWESFVHADDAGTVLRSWNDAGQNKKNFSGEFRIVAAKGGLKWLKVQSQKIYHDKGERAVTVAKDISELKEANFQLEATQRQMMLSERLASVGRLAAGMAHEINNPTGYVLSNSRTMLEYIIALKEFIKFIDGNAEAADIRKKRGELDIDYIVDDIDGLMRDNLAGLNRIKSIVSGLKNFSKNGSEGSEFAEADIEECLRETLIAINDEIKDCSEVKASFGGIRKVHCDSREIGLVFFNILINALQAIREPNRKEMGRIHVRTWEDEDSVYCSISDNGPGIPSDILPKLFDPFFTTKPEGKGTGLGLTISYDIIVNKHGGELSVVSEQGKGADFTVRLPKKRLFAGTTDVTR